MDTDFVTSIKKLEKDTIDRYIPNRRLVFEDDFDGNELDLNNWSYELGNVRNQDIEAQCYRKENVTIENSNLVITAKRENYAGKTWTSGCVITNNLQEFKYGRIEAKIKLPKVTGSWPAFWAKGANNQSIFVDGESPTVTGVPWPICGEIDIFEQYGTASHVESCIHYANNNGGHASSGGARSHTFDVSDYNVYALEWTENKLSFSVNNVEYMTFDVNKATANGINPFKLPHFLILNMAVKSETIVDEMKMYVDWVRVYSHKYENVPESIELNTSTLDLRIGENSILIPKYTPNDRVDCKTIWSSSDESVATCVGGYITAVGIGEAVITAKLKNDVKTECRVSVFL